VVLGVDVAMRRREFITLVGGAAVAAWPLAVCAQQPAMPIIGFLHIGTADAYTNAALASFRRGLQEAGYVEGQNVAIEYRFAENKGERLPELAADLVRRQVTVLLELSGGPLTALALKGATSTIPIVVAYGGDPVQLGLAASLKRPGRNVTGVTFYTTELVSKRVQLLCELVPQARRIAYLRPPPQLSTDVTGQMEADALATARDLGRQLLVSKVDSAQGLNDAFSVVINEHPDALLISSAPFFDTVEINDQLAGLTLRYAMPAMYQHRAFPAAGGLMSYGADQGEAFRQAGIYAGRILKGEKPADLPFQQSTKVEFVINLKTAKALGLTIPYPLLGRANEVIE
jgi:putative tryptophan/tyrosine transport system substrate-binding protein